jgi:hypothetical protein
MCSTFNTFILKLFIYFSHRVDVNVVFFKNKKYLDKEIKVQRKK